MRIESDDFNLWQIITVAYIVSLTILCPVDKEILKIWIDVRIRDLSDVLSMKIFQWNILKLNHIKFSLSIHKVDTIFIHIGDIIDVRSKSEPQFELKFETSFMVPTKKWFQFASFF